MRLRRPDPTAADAAVAEGLRRVLDGLRSGGSLRQAVERAALETSPFGACLAGLEAGRPLAEVLRAAARGSTSDEMRSALLVLSVQAEAGGDPVPAVEALEQRARSRVAASRETRALTTQARLSARAIILLTPGFLLLLLALDPAGTWSSLSQPQARLALTLGVLLQACGSLWISSIVSRPTARRDSSWLATLPVVRALAVAVSGRTRSRLGAQVAEAADTFAFILRAGAGPAKALELAAQAVADPFGEVLRDALARVRAGSSPADAIRDAVSSLPDGPGRAEAGRLAEAFGSAETLGVPLAAQLQVLAEDIRDAEASLLTEEVRRASVRVLLPLGLLILPAFVLACLVPLFLSGLEGISL